MNLTAFRRRRMVPQHSGSNTILEIEHHAKPAPRTPHSLSLRVRSMTAREIPFLQEKKPPTERGAGLDIGGPRLLTTPPWQCQASAEGPQDRNYGFAVSGSPMGFRSISSLSGALSAPFEVAYLSGCGARQSLCPSMGRGVRESPATSACAGPDLVLI